jgi:hypothetical protein
MTMHLTNRLVFSSWLILAGAAGVLAQDRRSGAAETQAKSPMPTDQADWADARLIDEKQKVIYLSDAAGVASVNGFLTQQRLPASFVHGGQMSQRLLEIWPREDKPPFEQADRTVYETVWREPGNGLIATWRVEVFKD